MFGPSLKHGTAIVMDLSEPPLGTDSDEAVDVTFSTSSRLGWAGPCVGPVQLLLTPEQVWCLPMDEALTGSDPRIYVSFAIGSWEQRTPPP